jgi:hypothetical protein
VGTEGSVAFEGHMVWSREFWAKTLEDPTAFWALVMAVATIILVRVAYIQLRSLVKTSKAEERTSKGDFIYTETRFFHAGREGVGSPSGLESSRISSWF